MTRPDDSAYMRRCLELAEGGSGMTSPNPMVGAVITYDGKIIGEGFHIKAGTPHAEVNAINSVTDRSLLPESTLYVNLEPCSHYGKTPPCADLIINSSIKRVVVGTVDTSGKVSGRGIEKMREAGIEVVTGVEEDASRELNRRFFTWHEKKRPYVILKWARSKDGFIDYERAQGDRAEPHWITGLPERVLVHKWRSEEDAILAGGATIRIDDPLLNVRLWSGKDPVKVIISRSGEIKPSAGIFTSKTPVIIFTRVKDISLPGAGIITLGEDEPLVENVLKTLYNQDILSIFVEGGAYVLREFITSGLWDEARRFTGRQCFGNGIKDPYPEMKPMKKLEFEMSTLEIETQKFN